QRAPVELAIAVDQADGATQMQQSDNVIDVLFIYRDASKFAGAELADECDIGVIEIEAHHFGARHHDVVDAHLLQIENIEQHALMPLRNDLAGIIDDGA